jgi:hypothetical protein
MMTLSVNLSQLFLMLSFIVLQIATFPTWHFEDPLTRVTRIS